MRTRLLAILAVLLVAVAIWFLRPKKQLDVAWVGERSISVWNRLAVVRDPLVTLHYGDRVEILERKNEHVRIRTPSSLVGWVTERQLVPPNIWRQRESLLKDALPRPVQARGNTRAVANVRLEPRRDAPRIFQLMPDTPLEFLARTTVEAPTQKTESSAEDSSQDASVPAESPGAPRRDEWWLVRGQVTDVGTQPFPVAGWVLSSLLRTSPPEALLDYTTGLRFVAWFELGGIMESDGPRPRYVAFGLRPADNPHCDFTLLRVFNWSRSRQRYETAYVEGSFCGKLPVAVDEIKRPATKWAPQTTEYIFRFENSLPKGREQRSYTTHGNLIRRERTAVPAR